MKLNKFLSLGLTACALSLASCNDFLDDNRYPLDKQTNSPDYWTTEQNLQAQVNALYSNFTGYGNGATWTNNYYYRSLNDDQTNHMYSGEGMVFARWDYQYAPNANSVWDASYEVVRKCNYIIENSNIPTEVKNNNFIAQARLIRAMQYYELVRALGDVPLITKVLDPADPELYGERTPRNTVMDFVLEDLNFAVANIIQQSSKLEFSKDMANAMKSDICLYEAAFAKYHQNDNTRANKFYQEVVNATTAIISTGTYRICDDYQSLYNSVFTADPANDMVSLQDNPEVIFMKGYQLGVLGNSAQAYLSSNTAIPGMNRDAFDAYLFKDGKPKALTSYKEDGRDTDAAEPMYDEAGNVTGVSIANLLEVRDDRLSKTIDSQLSFGNIKYTRVNSYPLSSPTGYTICKYVNLNIPTQQSVNEGSGSCCAPLYWLANIYCDYIEARAEMGQLTDADVTSYIKPLWDRAKIDTSNLSLAWLNDMNDPANNMGISSLLWEVRRLRRCELMFDCYHRYWDLIRWHQLELLDTFKHPNITLGANVSKVPEAALAGVTVKDGDLDASMGGSRQFTEREYLQPLGTVIINLYNEKGLTLPQNPGWEGN